MIYRQKRRDKDSKMANFVLFSSIAIVWSSFIWYSNLLGKVTQVTNVKNSDFLRKSFGLFLIDANLLIILHYWNKTFSL